MTSFYNPQRGVVVQFVMKSLTAVTKHKPRGRSLSKVLVMGIKQHTLEKTGL